MFSESHQSLHFNAQMVENAHWPFHADSKDSADQTSHTCTLVQGARAPEVTMRSTLVKYGYYDTLF